MLEVIYTLDEGSNKTRGWHAVLLITSDGTHLSHIVHSRHNRCKCMHIILCSFAIIFSTELGLSRLSSVLYLERHKCWFWLLDAQHWWVPWHLPPRTVHTVGPVGCFLSNVQDSLHEKCYERPPDMGIPPCKWLSWTVSAKHMNFTWHVATTV